MTLFILTETSAGYAIFKARDKKLLKRDDLATETETAAGVTSLMKLKQFRKFESAAAALEEAAALTDGKVHFLPIVTRVHVLTFLIRSLLCFPACLAI